MIMLKNRILAFTATLVLGASISSIAIAQNYEWYDGATNDGQFVWQVKATAYGIYSVGSDDGDGSAPRSAVLSKFYPNGDLVWRREFVIEDFARAYALAVDDNGIYVAGQTSSLGLPTNRFLRMFTHSGEAVWTYVEENPTTHADIRGVALDESGIYTMGTTAERSDQSGTQQSVLSGFSFSGERLWNMELGTDSRNGYAVTVGDGRLYATDNNKTVHVHSVDGTSLYQFSTNRLSRSGGIKFYEGFLYYTHANGLIRKTDLIGNQVFEVKFFPADRWRGAVWGLDVSERGVFVGGNTAVFSDGVTGTTIARYDHDGGEIANWTFKVSNVAPLSVSVLGSRIYLAGREAEYEKTSLGAGQEWRSLLFGDGITARISDRDLLPAKLVSLTHDSAPNEVAVLDHREGAGPIVASVSSLQKGATESLVRFSDDLKPVAFFAIQDMNGNGYAELAVVSRNPKQIDIRDSRTGAIVRNFAISPNYEVIAGAVAEIEEGRPSIAVLGKHLTRGEVSVAEYDLTSGYQFNSTKYNPSFVPVDLLNVPPVSRLPQRFAVVANNPDPSRQSKLEIRNRAGVVQNLWLGKNLQLGDVVSVPNDGDTNRAAVIRRSEAQDWTDVAIVDIEQRKLLSNIGFNPNFTPLSLFASPDADGNSFPQLAILGRHTSTGKEKVETRDQLTAQVTHNHWLWNAYAAESATAIGPVAGYSPNAFAVLERRKDTKKLRAAVLDALTGERLFYLDFFD